jgi:hypothetical protein
MGKEGKGKNRVFKDKKTYNLKYKIYRVANNSCIKGQRSLTVCVTKTFINGSYAPV